MDFRQLLQKNCDQRNPLVQLATHATQDYAHQGYIGEPSTTNHMVQEDNIKENLMVPNTFNMTEIFFQLQNVVSAGSSRNVGDNMWATDYKNSLTQDNKRVDRNESLVPRNPPQCENLAYYFSPVAEYPQSNLAMFNSNYRLYPPPEPSPLQIEEFQRVQKEMEESLKIYDSLKDDDVINKDTLETPKSKAANLKDVSKPYACLVYDDLSVEDVYGISDLGITYNDGEEFYNFVENYILKRSSKKYEKYRPNTAVEPCWLVTTDLTDNIKTARRCSHYGRNRFKMPTPEESTDRNDDYKELAESLAINEQYQDVIKVAKYNSGNFTRSHNSYVFLLTDAYLHEHCIYQACQTLFTWLKNEPDYADIPPSDFVMEDKSETNIDKEQLAKLTEIFIKAAQRSPHIPDARVQIALAKLCQIDQKYERSIDCYQSILNQKMDKNQYAYIRTSLGKSFVLVNKHMEAAKTFLKVRLGERPSIEANTNVGLMHLYFGHYKAAAIYLFSVVEKQISQGYQVSDDALLENSWSRLRLCFELQRRMDLCKAVDDQNCIEINRYLNEY